MVDDIDGLGIGLALYQIAYVKVTKRNLLHVVAVVCGYPIFHNDPLVLVV